MAARRAGARRWVGADLLSPGASSSPMMALGGKLLSSLFGNNLGSLGGSLAGYSGVKPSSASSMLSFAAALPGPLSRLETFFAAPAAASYAAPPPPAPKSSIWRWLLPPLIVLGLLWMLSRCMGSRDETTTMAPARNPPRIARRPFVTP